MDEIFDKRDLLNAESLRRFQTHNDTQSATRLFIQLLIFAVLALALIRTATPSLTVMLTLTLAFVWASLFAPFHECTHRTAFTSRRNNTIGAWITGILFGMAPSVYRALHFEHHRHTQDPKLDPEIQADPARFARWPATAAGWCKMASGYGLMLLKVLTLVRFSVSPQRSWDGRATWLPKSDERRRIVYESRILLAIWIIFFGLAAFVVPNGWGFIAAALIAHVFLSLWISAEHTGLPLVGSMLECTRSVESTRFVRWWIWNMNFHAEHHAWPGIPWHQLPATHAKIRGSLAHNAKGYVDLHRTVLASNRAST